jgi:hypothetical protein
MRGVVAARISINGKTKFTRRFAQFLRKDLIDRKQQQDKEKYE